MTTGKSGKQDGAGGEAKQGCFRLRADGGLIFLGF